MPDVSVYMGEGNSQTYNRFANLTYFYVQTTNELPIIAKKYLNKNAVIADFCCGAGEATQDISAAIGGISEAILVDITPDFLSRAKKAVRAEKYVTSIEGDISFVRLPQESCDAVVAKFAYHHIPDARKHYFLEQAFNILKPGGVLLLADIFTADVHAFYAKALETIEAQFGYVEGIKEFYTEIQQSTQTEFKVPRTFADVQYADAGFSLVEEKKIWPQDNSLGEKNGVYVLVLKKKLS